MERRYFAARSVPLVVVASTSPAAERAVARLRQAGAAVYVVQSSRACLRVATAVGPDTILVDDAFPSRLRELLAAHPRTARSAIEVLEVAERVVQPVAA